MRSITGLDYRSLDIFSHVSSPIDIEIRLVPPAMDMIKRLPDHIFQMEIKH